MKQNEVGLIIPQRVKRQDMEYRLGRSGWSERLKHRLAGCLLATRAPFATPMELSLFNIFKYSVHPRTFLTYCFTNAQCTGTLVVTACIVIV